MYDLPSEAPEEPGLPDIFHHRQPNLLEETFGPPDYPRDDIFVATDLNLYYDLTHKQWHKRPDWFAVLGVPNLYRGDDSRWSYVVWDERVIPFIVVELLSPGTEDEDLGKTIKKPKQPPGKWEVYEQILKIPYYAVFSRYTNELQLFKLIQGHYVKMPLVNNRFFLAEVKLGLGVWEGVYEGEERHWLRWYEAAGKWIPTKDENTAHERQQAAQERLQAELAKQQAAQERLRAEGAELQAAQERHRAEGAELQAAQERHRAEGAEQQAAQERHRAEQLAAKLRALGIDPD
jgi:Uma2 family endonuclease